MGMSATTRVVSPFRVDPGTLLRPLDGHLPCLCGMLQVTNIQSDALFILLVEKDAAFMRLAEDRFYNDYPSIIITAKGQPDVATR